MDWQAHRGDRARASASIAEGGRRSLRWPIRVRATRQGAGRTERWALRVVGCGGGYGRKSQLNHGRQRELEREEAGRLHELARHDEDVRRETYRTSIRCDDDDDEGGYVRLTVRKAEIRK